MEQAKPRQDHVSAEEPRAIAVGIHSDYDPALLASPAVLKVMWEAALTITRLRRAGHEVAGPVACLRTARGLIGGHVGPYPPRGPDSVLLQAYRVATTRLASRPAAHHLFLRLCRAIGQCELGARGAVRVYCDDLDIPLLCHYAGGAEASFPPEVVRGVVYGLSERSVAVALGVPLDTAQRCISKARGQAHGWMGIRDWIWQHRRHGSVTTRFDRPIAIRLEAEVSISNIIRRVVLADRRDGMLLAAGELAARRHSVVAVDGRSVTLGHRGLGADALPDVRAALASVGIAAPAMRVEAVP